MSIWFLLYQLYEGGFMQQINYIGHPSQIMGVEEYRLMNGKGDHMHMLHARNGLGLELTVNADRCADISRLYLDGKNLSYTSVAGNVASAYYSTDQDGFGFLKSFNCGFLTTCSLNNIGSPNEDEGKLHGLHGNIGNTPSDYIYHTKRQDPERRFKDRAFNVFVSYKSWIPSAG